MLLERGVWGLGIEASLGFGDWVLEIAHALSPCRFVGSALRPLTDVFVGKRWRATALQDAGAHFDTFNSASALWAAIRSPSRCCHDRLECAQERRDGGAESVGGCAQQFGLPPPQLSVGGCDMGERSHNLLLQLRRRLADLVDGSVNL
jgi:hypothetical protein